MSAQTGRLAWRSVASPGSDHPLLPAIVLVTVLALTAAAGLILPGRIAGPGALAVAALALAATYLVWPKTAMLCFALLMLFSRTLSRWIQPELAHLDELFMPALVVLAAARTRPWRNRQWLVPAREAGLVVMLAAGAVAAIVGGVPVGVWGFGLLLTLKIFGFLYVVLWHDFRAHDVRQLYPVVLGLALVVLAIGMLEALDPNAVRSALNLGGIGSTRESLPSIKSLLWHPSIFSWFAAFVSVFMFAGYVVLRRWWLLVGGILFSGATVLSARRRALVGLAIAVAAGFAATLGRGGPERRMWRGWIPVAIGAAVLALAFLPSLIGLVRLGVEEATNSSTARVAMYGASVRIAGDHFPLGVGFGRFGSAQSANPYSPIYVQYGLDGIDGLSPANSAFIGDAYWAGVLGETGALGALGLIVFSASLAVASWHAARRTYRDPLAIAFTLGAWMAFVHALVETTASTMFDSPPRIYLLFGAVGVALALSRAEVIRGEAAAPDSPRG